MRYLELAGDHATDAFANEEAIASFRAALAVTQRPADADAMANGPWRPPPCGCGPGSRTCCGAPAAARRPRTNSAPRCDWATPVDPLLRAHLYTRLGRLELTSLDYEAATAAFDAAEALLGDHPGDGDGDGDATADQWLEMMIDGRADVHVMRFEPDRALEVLEAARPVLEAHGTPARRYVFDRLYTQQRLIRNRFQVDDADLARLRSSLQMAEHTGEDKDLGYATHFLGWAPVAARRPAGGQAAAAERATTWPSAWGRPSCAPSACSRSP